MSSEEPRIGPFILRQIRKRFLLFIALVGLVIGIPGYIQSAQNYANHSIVVAHNEQPLNIVMARGDTVAVSLQVDGGIEDYWASDQGLALSLDEVNTPLLVVGSKKPNWDDKLSVSQLSDVGKRFSVDGSFTLPSALGGPEQRLLLGKLSGSIYYPEGAEIFHFRQKTLNVSIPVRIQLVPPGSLLQSSGRLYFDAFAGLEMLWGLLLLLLAIWTLLRTFSGLLKPKAPESRNRKQIQNDWIWGLGGGAGFAAVSVGILAFLLVLTSTTWTSNPYYPPSEISLLGWLICGLVGLSVWLGTLAVMIRDDKKKAGIGKSVPL